MEGLMMMQPGFEKKNCRIKEDLLNGNENADVYTYLILNWRRGLFRFKRDLLGNQLRRSLRSSW
jgi:hypothetical protein